MAWQRRKYRKGARCTFQLEVNLTQTQPQEDNFENEKNCNEW